MKKRVEQTERASVLMQTEMRKLTRLFFAALMWWGVIRIGRCAIGVDSSPRLRFSPLQVFAQRQLEPILS
jgi:hypothetical protein